MSNCRLSTSSVGSLTCILNLRCLELKSLFPPPHPRLPRLWCFPLCNWHLLPYVRRCCSLRHYPGEPLQLQAPVKYINIPLMCSQHVSQCRHVFSFQRTCLYQSHGISIAPLDNHSSSYCVPALTSSVLYFHDPPGVLKDAG